MWCEPGKWTCPECVRTIVIDGPLEDAAVAIPEIQKRHGKLHQQERYEDMKRRIGKRRAA